MENHTLKYKEISKELEEKKKEKNILETEINNKKIERNETNIILFEKKKEKEILNEKICKMVNNKDNLINTVSAVLWIITLIIAIYLGVNIVSGVVGTWMQVLVTIGVFIGMGNAYTLVFTAIYALNYILKEKTRKKNMSKPNVIALIKEFSNKNKDISKTKEKLDALSNEINSMEIDLKKLITLIDSKTTELEELKNEIVKFVIEPKQMNNIEEEQNVGYKRIRKI